MSERPHSTEIPLDESDETADDVRRWPLWLYYAYGVVVGALGAAAIAVLFLVVDIATGRPPLWTPAALGSALFLGESLGATQSFDPFELLPVIVGYTAVHGAVFGAFGAWGALTLSLLPAAESARGRFGTAALLALLLFAAFEVTFMVFSWLFEPDVLGALGGGWVALANALAAVLMASILVWSGAPLRAMLSVAGLPNRRLRASHAEQRG